MKSRSTKKPKPTNCNFTGCTNTADFLMVYQQPTELMEIEKGEHRKLQMCLKCAEEKLELPIKFVDLIRRLRHINRNENRIWTPDVR